MRRRGVLLCGVLSHDFNQSFPRKSVESCDMLSMVLPAAPRYAVSLDFFGGDASLPPIERKGVAGMDVTWEGIFQFCMLIAAVIALVLQANNKKR